MLIFTSDSHRGHARSSEFFRGSLVPCFESALRTDLIQSYLEVYKFGEFRSPDALPMVALEQIHSSEYLQFVQTIHSRWCQKLQAEGQSVAPETVEIIPHTFPTRHLNQNSVPNSVYGQVGYYAMDTATPITAGSYEATRGATLCAVNAVQALAEGKTATAFSLSRPPGHHASSDGFGGYCFFNHAAVAAQHWLNLLRSKGATTPSIAILDVDFHHGNGTQSIFYDRNDVLFVSIHADPAEAYPYFLGLRDETGHGEGIDCNVNLPLALGSGWGEFGPALQAAMERIASFSPQGLVVSFGADTHEADPISGFRLSTANFNRMGNMIRELNLPTAIVMEGGYAVNILGEATYEFLNGIDLDR